jgi:mRNA interferase MazF
MKVGLAIMCPITRQVKGYPFEVQLPRDLSVSGAILSDQVRSLDWRERKAELICRVPREQVVEAMSKLHTLLSAGES